MLELSRFVLPSATLRRFMTKAPMPTLQFKCVPSGAFARDHGADRPGTIWLRSTSASLRRFMKKAMPELQFKFAPSGAFARAAWRTGPARQRRPLCDTAACPPETQRSTIGLWWTIDNELLSQRAPLRPQIQFDYQILHLRHRQP